MNAHTKINKVKSMQLGADWQVRATGTTAQGLMRQMVSVHVKVCVSKCVQVCKCG